MSFMTLMGIEGWSTPAPSPHDAKDLWQDFNIPMGANIQFIFYRNRRGRVLVRFMNNENDIRFPIPSETAPYYDWNALRTYIQGRIDLARRIIATTEAPPKKSLFLFESGSISPEKAPQLRGPLPVCRGHRLFRGNTL